MAGDWIKMRSNLWTDPRVLKLCDMTDSAENEVVGALYWLWAAADQHSEDGSMPGMTLRTIDRKGNVTGLADALLQVGWIEQYDGGLRIARFDEHNGESAKRRCTDAKRKANGRKTSEKLRTEDGQVADDLRESSELEKEKEKESKSTSLVASPPAGDPNFGPAKHTPLASNKPDCPHQDIIALYHQLLPQCPQIRDWTPARQANLRARWNEDPKHQKLAYWQQFFEFVGTCDFLVGRSKTVFFADLAWMTRPENFAKIREEKYVNRG